MAEPNGAGRGSEQVKDAVQDLLRALGDRAIETAQGRITDATERLTDIGSGGGILGKAATGGAKASLTGGSPVWGALKGGFGGITEKIKDAIPGLSGGGGGKATKATKATNVVETIDVGVPVDVAYNQWTQYDQWPEFMKKVERAEQEQDEPKVDLKAQVFWSHRNWEATIKEQVPNETIVWRSRGPKGHVDGSVTFHELAPRLTRILVVLEYYPQGLFERTGNLWRAQGRRARAEIKHFRRHVMMNTILDPDEVEGWRGEIHDSEVTRTHDEVVEEEQQYEDEQLSEDSEGGDRADDEGTEEDEEVDEYEEQEPEEAEETMEEEEPAPRRRRRRSA